MRLLPSIFAFLAVALHLSEGAIVCYFSSWAVYRTGDGKFDVEDVDPTICTHLVFAFAGLGWNNEIKVLDPWNELCDNYGKCAYDRFTKLKEKNTNLKTTLAVGGWNEGSTKYSDMAKDPSKRNKFITSAIALIKEHNFDGMDLDWEYPTQRGGKPEDKDNFVTLLQELSDALHAEGLILSIAVSAGKATIDEAYHIPAVSNAVDFIHLMAYDLHGAWDDYTHHQSGLYPHPDDTGDNIYLNDDFAVNYWLENGADKNKLILGIPLYGRCWSLDHDDQTGYYAPASRPGAAGPFTRLPGFQGYNEICADQQIHDWVVVNDPVMHEPYAYYLPNQKLWCSYEHTASAATKAQYALDNGLGGCMVWSVETDDFKAKCGEGKFPLINTIATVFSGGIWTKPPTQSPAPTTTRDPDVTTAKPPPTPSPPEPSDHCDHLGLNPDHDDCTHYFMCDQDSDGSFVEYEEFCPPGTLFNPVGFMCDWPDSVCHLTPKVCPNDCP